MSRSLVPHQRSYRKRRCTRSMTSVHPGCESALASLMYNREEVVCSTALVVSRREHLLVAVGHERRPGEYRYQSRHEVQCSNVKTSAVIDIVQMLSAVIRVILCSLAVMFVKLEANPSHLKHKLMSFFLKLDTSSISPVHTLSYSAFSTRTCGESRLYGAVLSKRFTWKLTCFSLVAPAVCKAKQSEQLHRT